MNKETDNAVKRILDNPEFSLLLQIRRNDYGDSYLDNAVKKASYGAEIAETFGFDPVLTMAILTLKELAIPNFNGIGDEFLLEIDPQYTRALYGRRLAAKILCSMDPEESKVICDGVAHAIEKQHFTPEEKIVQMIDTGFAFSVTLNTPSLASLFNYRYKEAIIQKTADAGVLTDYIISPDIFPRREPIALTEEERKRRKALLHEKYAYYLAHPDQIPEAFSRGWGDLDTRILVSYYIVWLKELNEDT